jgi:hypothetical protein
MANTTTWTLVVVLVVATMHHYDWMLVHVVVVVAFDYSDSMNDVAPLDRTTIPPHEVQMRVRLQFLPRTMRMIHVQFANRFRCRAIVAHGYSKHSLPYPTLEPYPDQADAFRAYYYCCEHPETNQRMGLVPIGTVSNSPDWVESQTDTRRAF